MGCSPWGRYESDTTEQLHFHFSLSCIGEGNGNPFQCSCLENPRDGGAWWAAVYGVAQSRTRLKRLSSSSSNVFCHGGSSNLFTLEWILILGMGWPFFTCHASQATITTEKNPLLWYANCYNIVSHLIAGSISHH